MRAPLHLLRSGQSDRAWEAVHLLKAASRLNWICLLAWEMAEGGGSEEARRVLREAAESASLGEWSDLFVELVTQAARLDVAATVDLLVRTGATGADTSLIEGVAYNLLVGRETPKASDVVRALPEGEARSWAWSRVASRLASEGRANGGLALAAQVDHSPALAHLLSTCLAKAPSLASHPQFTKAFQRLDGSRDCDQVRSLLAVILVGQGNLQEAHAACAEVHHVPERARALGLVAASAFPLGHADEARALLGEVLALLPAVQEPGERSRVLAALCRAAGVEGDLDRARTWLDEARVHLEALQVGRRAETLIALAEDAFVAGFEDEVRELLGAVQPPDATDAVEDLRRRLGMGLAGASSRPNLDAVRNRFKRGGAVVAMPMIERLAAEGGRLGSGGVAHLCDLARLCGEFGQQERAENLLAEATEALDCPGCRPSGRPEGDRDDQTRSPATGAATEARGTSHLHMALAKGELGRLEEACRALDCPVVPETVRLQGLRSLATWLLAKGDAVRAREVLALALGGAACASPAV